MIVKQKQNGCQNPGHRIIEERYGERREEGNHSENPYHTEQADTAGCDEHRNDDIAHAAQRTGEDLGKDEQPVKRSHGRHHFQSDLHDIFIGHKNVEERNAEAYEHQHQKDGGSKVHADTHADTFSDAVILPGAVVLTDESCDGNTESTADHPDDCVQFSVSRPCGNGVGSEFVERGLDNHVGNAVHGILKSSRQSQKQF